MHIINTLFFRNQYRSGPMLRILYYTCTHCSFTRLLKQLTCLWARSDGGIEPNEKSRLTPVRRDRTFCPVQRQKISSACRESFRWFFYFWFESFVFAAGRDSRNWLSCRWWAAASRRDRNCRNRSEPANRCWRLSIVCRDNRQHIIDRTADLPNP